MEARQSLFQNSTTEMTRSIPHEDSTQNKSPSLPSSSSPLVDACSHFLTLLAVVPVAGKQHGQTGRYTSVEKLLDIFWMRSLGWYSTMQKISASYDFVVSHPPACRLL